MKVLVTASEVPAGHIAVARIENPDTGEPEVKDTHLHDGQAVELDLPDDADVSDLRVFLEVEAGHAEQDAYLRTGATD